jgi:hypothetical protein
MAVYCNLYYTTNPNRCEEVHCREIQHRRLDARVDVGHVEVGFHTVLAKDIPVGHQTAAVHKVMVHAAEEDIGLVLVKTIDPNKVEIEEYMGVGPVHKTTLERHGHKETAGEVVGHMIGFDHTGFVSVAVDRMVNSVEDSGHMKVDFEEDFGHTKVDFEEGFVHMVESEVL